MSARKVGFWCLCSNSKMYRSREKWIFVIVMYVIVTVPDGLIRCVFSTSCTAIFYEASFKCMLDNF